jgi:hypothetical protein
MNSRSQANLPKHPGKEDRFMGGLLYLFVGLACGVAVGMGMKRKRAPALSETAGTLVDETAEETTIDPPNDLATDDSTAATSAETPTEPDTTDRPTPARFPDVEYDLESDDL